MNEIKFWKELRIKSLSKDTSKNEKERTEEERQKKKEKKTNICQKMKEKFDEREICQKLSATEIRQKYSKMKNVSTAQNNLKRNVVETWSIDETKKRNKQTKETNKDHFLSSTHPAKKKSDLEKLLFFPIVNKLRIIMTLAVCQWIIFWITASF